MKMKKSLVALCLSAGLLASVPAVTFADVNFVPQNTSAAPAIPAAAPATDLDPVDQSKVQSTQLSAGGQQLNVPGITGPVAAFSVPANIGELTLTLTSEVNKQTSVFAPNVLILDQNMTPSAFFPSEYFGYQEPGVMSRPPGRENAPDACAGSAEDLCSGLHHRERFAADHQAYRPGKAYAKAQVTRYRISGPVSAPRHRWPAEAESLN
jgi:hypothetical protein